MTDTKNDINPFEIQILLAQYNNLNSYLLQRHTIRTQLSIGGGAIMMAIVAFQGAIHPNFAPLLGFGLGIYLGLGLGVGLLIGILAANNQMARVQRRIESTRVEINRLSGADRKLLEWNGVQNFWPFSE
jgi:hypothetical protein